MLIVQSNVMGARAAGRDAPIAGARNVETIFLAQRRRTAYDSDVPEKGNRFGSLNRKKRTDRAMRFFYVRMLSHVSYERRWQGSLRACWVFFFHQSSNPVICRPPRLEAGRGLTVKKEALMPSSICTSEYSQSELKRQADNANTFSALLSCMVSVPAVRSYDTLQICSDMANAVARDLVAMLDAHASLRVQIGGAP
ncbi:MAG: hypothetical protein ACXW24_16075 [Telluria sp.]